MTLNDLAKAAAARGWKTVPGKPLIVELPLDGGRHQAVRVEEFRDGSALLLRMTSAIGSADTLDPRRLRSALELNARMPQGCLAISEGQLAMTDTRPAGESDESLLTVLAFIARQSDSYEKLIYGTDTH